MNRENRIYLNDGWMFTAQYSDDLLKSECMMDLEDVRLPHCGVELPYHYFDESLYQKDMAYRRVFIPDVTWEGKHVFLTVEGAAHRSEVYLNGQFLYTHRCGYTAYTVDLAPAIAWGEENVLVIRVDSRETLNQPPFGNVIDYMTFAGLYREVYLQIKNQSYIKDVFAKVTRVEKEQSASVGMVKMSCEVDIENGEGHIFKQFLLDDEWTMIAKFGENATEHSIADVRLWDVESPTLYYVKTVLYKDGAVVDCDVRRIGFRMIDFRADGVYINGSKLKLRGMNRHQSYPYVGYAMPKSMQREDARILKKELSLNAVRTSHYPQSHHFLDACDEMGLLVFTEIPGWQHIGDETWKEQAVENTREMVMQYRNHPSIFLWGVRINESLDDDAFYTKTNAVAHELDDTRKTSGVRYIQKSSLLEDIYAYNDFSHDGTNPGAMLRERVTPDSRKGYLISEHNGHMYTTKAFDAEDIRVEHLLRHARVVNAYYEQEDVAGGFAWCMFDYNTHKDFGSGDRICYHGVLDMFRNPKLASSVYASQKEPKTSEDVVLEISSAMDIGEHPACLMKDVYAITNADSVRVYKNDSCVGEYTRKDSPFKKMPYGPILIDDFIGDIMEKGEGFSHSKAEDIKKVLLAANKYGLSNLPLPIKLLAAKCMVFRGMKMSDAVALYNKYVGNWGGVSTTYRFEAIKDGKVVKTVTKTTVKKPTLEVEVSHTDLVEENTYDVASIRLQAVSENGDVLPLCNAPIHVSVEGDIALIGPKTICLRGGMGGLYVKTMKKEGTGTLRICMEGDEDKTIVFQIGKQ